jgi:hypothetical protein
MQLLPAALTLHGGGADAAAALDYCNWRRLSMRFACHATSASQWPRGRTGGSLRLKIGI